MLTGQAQASGPRVSILRGRGELMQVLAVEDAIQTPAPVYSVAVAPAADSEDMLLAAGAGGACIIWRLPATHNARFQRIPEYGRWVLDEVVQTRAERITTLGLCNNKLAVGCEQGIIVYEARSSRQGVATWTKVWSCRAPRQLLLVRWSPDAFFLSAVPVQDGRVLLWHWPETAGQKSGAMPELTCRLEHTRHVHGLEWRLPRDRQDHQHVLVVTTEDCVARVYAPIMDEPFVLRQWAAVDAALDVESTAAGIPRTARSLMYCTARHATLTLREEIQHMEQQLQAAQAGVGSGKADATSLHALCKRLAYLLENTPDLFFAFLHDGSVVIHALANVDKTAPTLLHCYIVFKLPAVIPVAPESPLVMQYVPWPPPDHASGHNVMIPMAVIHAQSRSGMRGSLALSPAHLLDGEMSSIRVQHALTDSRHIVPSKDKATALLHAGHAADIELVDVAPGRTAAVSVSNDNHLVLWQLVAQPNGHRHGSAMRSRYSTHMPHSTLACALNEERGCAAVNEREFVLVQLGKDKPSVQTSPFSSVQGTLLSFGVVSSSAQGCALAACTSDAYVLTWTVSGDSISSGSSQLDERLSLSAASWSEPVGDQHSYTRHLLTMSTDGVLQSWELKHEHATVSWRCLARVETGLRKVHAISGNAAQQIAAVSYEGGSNAQWRLTLWDSGRAEFCDPCLWDMAFELRGAPAPSIDWSNCSGLGNILALSTGFRVNILAPSRATHAGAGQLRMPKISWGTLCSVSLDDLGCGVSHVRWMDAERLLVSSGCQLFLHEPRLVCPGEKQTRHISEALAEHASALPYAHPQHLLHCLAFGLLDAVQAILRVLRSALSRRTGNAEPTSLAQLVPADAIPSTVFRQCRAAWSPHGRTSAARTHTSLFEGSIKSEETQLSASEFRELLSLLEQPISGLDKNERMTLYSVVQGTQSVVEQATSVDAYGLRALTALPLLPGYTDTVEGSDREILPPMLWAHFSESQEALLSKLQAACSNRMTWRFACASGVFFWVRSSERLHSLLEQVARTAYTESDSNPVLATLLYLALRKPSMVQTLWKRAIGHADREKMVNFLSKDFSEERWRVAAQKNAFVLMSQRRFDLAAAFFLLGGSLRDTVNVCVRNLKDVQLAIAVARAYGGDSDPVFQGLLSRQVVPLALEKGDRWLGWWALSMLEEHADMLHMVSKPLFQIAQDATFQEKYGHAQVERGCDSTFQPELVLLVDHAKAQPWFASTGDALPQATETRLVAFAARVLDDLGCGMVSMALLSNWSFARASTVQPTAQPAPKQSEDHGDSSAAAPTEAGPPKKIGSLLHAERKPASSQGAMEFDMSSFGF